MLVDGFIICEKYLRASPSISPVFDFVALGRTGSLRVGDFECGQIFYEGGTQWS